MAVESFYFSHDYGARNDPKLQKVLQKLGHAGKGVYWDIVELMYEEGGKLLLMEIDDYCFTLRVEKDLFICLINNFDLFQKDDNYFWSETIIKRLSRRSEKSKKAQKSALARWGENANAGKNDANAGKNDAIKERKERKENKEYKGEEKEKYFLPVFDELFSFFKNKIVWDDKRCEKEALKFLERFQGVTDMINWQKNAETWFYLGVEFDKKKIVPNGMPNHWDKNYYLNLSGKGLSDYFSHLNNLGYKAVKDRQNNLIEFAK